MKVYIITFTLILSFSCFTQDRLFSCGDNGEIIEFSQNDCSARSLGVYNVFGDIAITPNGNMYGITDRLYQIDTVLQVATEISMQLITNIGGLGLMAIDNNTLLYDKNDSLYLYDVSSNIETLLGVVGYGSNGDFTMFEGSIYMISSNNELIRITLNSANNSIESISNMGLLNTHSFSAYSIFTAYENCTSENRSLFVIDERKVYKVDELTAQIEENCNLTNQEISYGTATFFATQNNSIIGEIPNVFTPNGDGINDIYSISSIEDVSLFNIVNRWGNVVYSWDSGLIQWDGTINGMKASEGVYFYNLQFQSCGSETQKTGHISLLR